MANLTKNRQLTNDDLFMMAKGVWYRSYEKMGAHMTTEDGVQGYHFAVWAPDVRSVHVIGEFNGWDNQANPLTCSQTGGVWEGFVPGVVEGQLYKYVIETRQGDLLFKADPYAFNSELIPGTASRTSQVSGYEWGDADFLEARRATPHMKRPLNIYEVHLGSWKRHNDGLAGNGDPDSDDHAGSYLTYDELADQLVPYVKEMGYSHVEFLPVMEHPFDGSWGYQLTGYYAPTSRYGTAQQFEHLIDEFHKAGIGVILDWVPGGFCADAQGLANFNGSMLYEKAIHPNWGTYKFDLGRGEVRTFLISNLLYWIERYHVDGIRMDGVTSMLYLNFGIDDPAQKIFNEKGTEEDFASIEFIQMCNETVGKYFPDVMMIAEESTAWPLVTRPPEVGGLGFNYKWDMGWMNDTLHYMQCDFPFRPGNHKLLTFSIMYAFNENFLLPFSHDEVVHGKCSLITRMPGDTWRQFAGMRALAFYQMTHPGGKLNFMGNEIAQFIEWRYYEGIEYFLAENYENHRNQQKFIAALNAFYNEHPALWQRAYTSDGFDWIEADDAEQCVISYARHGDDPKDDLVVLLNFEVNPYEEFRLGVPRPGIYEEVFNTDASEFGGSGVTNTGVQFKSEEKGWNNQADSVVVRVPPLGGMILRYVKPLPKKRVRKTTTAKSTTGKSTAAKTTAAKTTTKRTTKAATTKAAATKTTAAKTTTRRTTKAAAAKAAEEQPAAEKKTTTRRTTRKKTEE